MPTVPPSRAWRGLPHRLSAKPPSRLQRHRIFPMKSDKSVTTELRIVAGSLRGRKVIARVHGGLRPTPQRVRESLFSILGNAVPGRAFFDIFAGTGIVGLEAVSRGASEARLIEGDGA